MGENLITVEKIKDVVRQKKMNTSIEEEEYYHQLNEINERVRSRDLLITNYDEKQQKRRTKARLLLRQYND